MNTEAAEPLSRAASGFIAPQRGVSDASAIISHFDDWAKVLGEAGGVDATDAESTLSRRGSGKLEGLEPDALRHTVDGLLKRQPGPSKLQPQLPVPPVLPCTKAMLDFPRVPYCQQNHSLASLLVAMTSC